MSTSPAARKRTFADLSEDEIHKKRQKIYEDIETRCWRSFRNPLTFHKHFINTVELSNWVLLRAIRKGNYQIIRSLVQSGIKIESIDESGRMAIHAEADREYPTCVNDLFCNADDVNFSDQRGFTHFHAACISGNAEMVRKFIDQGIDVDLAYTTLYDKWITTLHLAVDNKKVEVVKLLLENGANPNALRYRNTLLHDICSDLAREYFIDQNLQIMRLLVKHNSNVNAANGNGNTPLFSLFNQFRSDGIQKLALNFLLSNGADVTHVNNIGQNILHTVIYTGASSSSSTDRKKNSILIEIIDILIENGANLNGNDKYGRTPVQMAVSSLNYELVNALLKRKASVESILFEEKYFKHQTDKLPTLELVLNFLALIRVLLNHGWNKNYDLTILNFLIGFNNLMNTNTKCVLAYGSESQIYRFFNEPRHLTFTSRKRMYHDLCNHLKIVHIGKMYMSKKVHDFLFEKLQTLASGQNFIYKQAQFVRQEIVRSKILKLIDHLSLFDFCCYSPKKAYGFLNNSIHDLMIKLEYLIVMKKLFFRSGEIMKGYIAKSLVRGYVEKIALDYVRFLSIPINCQEKIIQYLDNEDLLFLCQAFMC